MAKKAGAAPPIDLVIETVPVDRLTLDPRNARKHPKRNLEAIAASLAEFGQRRPLVVASDYTVVAGNGTLAAAVELLGWTEVAVTVLPWDDPERCKAFALTDNRTAELAEWDAEILAEQLGELDDFGWDMTRFGFDGEGPPLIEDEPPALDQLPVRCTPGDLWICGRHRVLVGDATSLADVERATGGVPVDLVFTDPPYGVAYVGGSGLTIVNDDLEGDALFELLRDAFTNFGAVLRPGGPFYICSPSGQLETLFRLALAGARLQLRQQLVWVKDRHVLGRQDYHGRHETILYGWSSGELPPAVPPEFPLEPVDGLPEADALYAPEHDTILYGWKGGAAHPWNGGRKQNSVWEVDRPARSPDHPTMKPVELVAKALRNSTDPGGLVLDPFGGSGSTLAAAEQTSRSCATIELDPRYADVIVARWEALTGDTAVREEG